jgi:hypothetical protein
MSNLLVQNIKHTNNTTAQTIDTSGRTTVSIMNNDSTYRSDGGAVTQNMVQGVAKSWVYFKGSDTFGIQDSFNTASATDNNQGDYTTTRTNAFANDDYATAGICSSTGGGNIHYNTIVENQDNRLRSTTALRIYILNPTGPSTYDAIDVSLLFFGDLA